MRCHCGREIKLDEASRPRTHVYEDPTTGEPFMYLLNFECGCGTTRSLVLYQDAECTAAELEEDAAEAAGAALYERDEAPLDRATHRGFFSLTHELAELGL